MSIETCQRDVENCYKMSERLQTEKSREAAKLAEENKRASAATTPPAGRRIRLDANSGDC